MLFAEAPALRRGRRPGRRPVRADASLERARHRRHAPPRGRAGAAGRARQPGRAGRAAGRATSCSRVDAQPLKGTAELLAAVAARKAGDKLILQVRGAAAGSASRTVDVTLGESAREVPLHDAELVYNKAMMDLRSTVEGYPGTERRGLRLAEPGAVRDALLRLRRGPRLPAEGARGAADAPRPVAGHRRLLHGPRPREARLPAAGQGRLPRGRGGEGRDAHRQRRARRRRDRRAAGRRRERAARLVGARRASPSSSPSTAARSRSAATRRSPSASTSRSSRAATRASRSAGRRGSSSTSTRRTSRA